MGTAHRSPCLLSHALASVSITQIEGTQHTGRPRLGPTAVSTGRLARRDSVCMGAHGHTEVRTGGDQEITREQREKGNVAMQHWGGDGRAMYRVHTRDGVRNGGLRMYTYVRISSVRLRVHGGGTGLGRTSDGNEGWQTKEPRSRCDMGSVNGGEMLVE